MQRIVMTWIVGLLFAPSAIISHSFADDTVPQKPNILWLIAEDMCPDMSCYGTPEVQTPNLDALAARGMRFNHAYTVTPVCSTSRSSFMTGMYACTINAQNHRSHRSAPETPNPLPDGVRPITHWLNDAGYYTSNLRHFADKNDPDWMHGTGKTDWNFSSPGKAFNTWGSIEELPKHQPFYAQVNFSETHRGEAWADAKQHIDNPVDPAKVQIPPYYPDHPVVRADWAQYLDCVQAMDREVGVVLRRLDELGLADNTIIIFIGDHGRAMPRGKQWPYDAGLHIPLIMYWPAKLNPPAQYKAGSVSDQFIESIDLSATTLSMAGMKKPEKMQGRIFMGPHADEPRRYTFGTRDRCDETVDYIRAVRDERFHYIRNGYPDRPFLQLNRYKETEYPIIAVLRYLDKEGKLTGPPAQLMAPTRPAQELYDLQADPYEINNLADDPKYADVLTRLSGVLDQWIVDVNDQGRTPEPDAVVEHCKQQMIKFYEKTGRLQKARAEYLKQIKAAESK